MIPALLTLATLAALMLMSGCRVTKTSTPEEQPKSDRPTEVQKAVEDASRRMIFECIRLEGMPRLAAFDGRFLYCDYDLLHERERRERSKQ